MRAHLKSEFDEKASVQQESTLLDDIQTAWYASASEALNAVSILRLTSESLANFDHGALGRPASFDQVSQQISDIYHAVDAVVPMIANVETFLDCYLLPVVSSLKQADKAADVTPTMDGVISEALQYAIDQHKWALDTLNELTRKTDNLDEMYDPSPAVEKKCREASVNERQFRHDLTAFPALTRSERRLKASYLRVVLENGLIDESDIHAILVCMAI